MLVLFSINHPSQYHMFKHLARKIVDSKGSVIFFIQSRGIVENLVVHDGFDYRHSTSSGLRKYLKGRYGVVLRSIISITQQETRIFVYNLWHKVDFMLGSDIAIAHVGFLFRRVSIVFTDDDYIFTKPYCHLAYPFARHIFAPIVADTNKWRYKQIGYYGTQKTGYLHPRYFVPNETVLDKYSLRGTRYFIIRLVVFQALHDSIHTATTGITSSLLDRLIPYLEKKGRVIISYEGGSDTRYPDLCLKIDPQDMHSLIYYADLLISDSQSMHVEAGLLGTPAIRSNKWVLSKGKVSVIDYLENIYNLGLSIAPNKEDDLDEAVHSLVSNNAKLDWVHYKNKFFAENTNFTDFLFWFLEGYPISYQKYRKNPNIVQEFVK